MRLTDTVEILYLTLMFRWEKTAPPDQQQSLLDEKVARNTQISRMAYLLKKIAAGDEDRTYQRIARYTVRNDGESYVSKNSSWMKEPYKLNDDWYFEGCTSLVQKQWILQQLTKLGLSAAFVACADDFVAAKSVEKYFPTEEEVSEILRKIRQQEESDEGNDG